MKTESKLFLERIERTYGERGCVIKPKREYRLFAGWGPKLFLAALASGLAFAGGSANARAAEPDIVCATPGPSAVIDAAAPFYGESMPTPALPATAEVGVDLGANGNVTNAWIARSSGDPFLDRAALLAARKTQLDAPMANDCGNAIDPYIIVEFNRSE
jgi:TonB family protein